MQEHFLPARVIDNIRIERILLSYLPAIVVIYFRRLPEYRQISIGKEIGIVIIAGKMCLCRQYVFFAGSYSINSYGDL